MTAPNQSAGPIKNGTTPLTSGIKQLKSGAKNANIFFHLPLNLSCSESNVITNKGFFSIFDVM
jgi:X-X-X-Leu-X-X-Gly heptad repeat protein